MVEWNDFDHDDVIAGTSKTMDAFFDQCGNAVRGVEQSVQLRAIVGVIVTSVFRHLNEAIFRFSLHEIARRDERIKRVVFCAAPCPRGE